MVDRHGDAQKYIVATLRHYGFNAKSEYNVEGAGRRIDCAGWCADEKLCDSHSIGIEISRTSDLAKDISSLAKTSFDLKFIISLKPYGQLPHPEGYYIVEPDLFENALRSILGVPKDYPLYSPIYARQEVNLETIRKYATEILREIGKNPQEIVSTSEFEEITKEILEIYRDTQTFSGIEEMKQDLEDILRNRYEFMKSASVVGNKRRKVLSYEEILPEGVNDDEWDRALKSIEKFKENLEMAGFPYFVDKAMKILLRAYSAGENGILSRVIFQSSGYSEPEITSHIPPQLYNLLEGLGYLWESEGRGNYQGGRAFFAYLTPKGKELASSFAWKKLKENREFIDEQIEIYGEILSLMACIADMPKGGLIGGIKIPTEQEKYENAFLDGIWEPSDFSYEYSQRAERIGVPLNIELFFESAIRLPIIKDKIIEFWRAFEDKDLVAIEPHFGSHGGYYGDFIHSNPVLSYYILRKTKDKAVEKLNQGLVDRLNAINVIHTLKNLFRRNEKISLDDILMIAGLSKEYFGDVAEELYEKGITSKLMDSPPYLIFLDENRLQEYLIEKLKEIEEDILSEIS